MKTNTSSNIIVAALFAAVLFLSQLAAQAVIRGPYTADADTLHLYHLDSAGADTGSGGINLANVKNGAVFAASYLDFGNALNTTDGGLTSTAVGNKDAFQTTTATTVPINPGTLADPITGAFTMEALVLISFDPTKNYGSTTGGGLNRGTPCLILTGDSATPANRVFQFRITPIRCNNAKDNLTVNLEFNNLNGGATQLLSVSVPTTGDDAIAVSTWYHVAVVYNGNAGVAGNLTFYWTKFTFSTATSAHPLGAAQTMTSDLLSTGVPTTYGVGNNGSSQNSNFLGYIDEVRISKIARAASDMMFVPAAAPPTITSQPASQTVGVGQSASFSVTATGGPLSYQWRHSGGNVGVNSSSYSIAAAQVTDAGPYDVVVSNPDGTVTSDAATLTVRANLDLTWRGFAGSAWDMNSVNWASAGPNVAYAQGDNVTFDNSGSAVPSVNLTGLFSPSAVVVNAGNDYTLSSSVGGGIVGSTGLTKSGAGKLVLDTDNSYTGPTLIQGGIVQLGAGGSQGSLGTGPVTDDAAIVVNRTGTVNFNNNLTGAGSLTNLLGGTISIVGANTLSGPIVLNAGTLSLDGPQAAGASTSLILNAPVAAGTTVLKVSGSATLSSGVTLSLLGSTEIPDSRCNVTAGDNSTTVLNGPIVVGGSGTVQFATAGGEMDVNGSVSGPAFTGKVILRGASGVGHVYGAINVPSANIVSKTDGGTWVLHSSGNSWTNSNLAVGTIRLAANNALPPGVVLAIGAGGVLDLAGFNQQLGGLTSVTTGNRIIGNSSTTSDSTLTLVTTDSWTFGGVIQDSVSGGTRKVGLTLSGGTLTLTNVSTFTGDTTISAGTLALNGAGSLFSTAGAISIAAGATFDVSGVTTPPYHVRTGKTLDGGGVAGGATINGALTLNGDSFLTLTYVSGTPAINVTGGELTLTANATTVTVSGAALGVGSYKLISASGGGSVAGTLPGSVTVGVSGLDANTTASLSLISGELWCVVQAANTAPTSPDLTTSLQQDQPMVLDISKLLAKASDADAGDTLSLTAAGPTSAHGPANNVVLNTGAGTITYTPATGYVGADSFTYTIGDNHGGTVTPAVYVTLTSAEGSPPNIVIPPEMLPNGHFHVGFAGIPGFSYTVQYSDNANGPWTTLTSLEADTHGQFDYEDPTEPAPSSRYYRAVYP